MSIKLTFATSIVITQFNFIVRIRHLSSDVRWPKSLKNSTYNPAYKMLLFKIGAWRTFKIAQDDVKTTFGNPLFFLSFTMRLFSILLVLFLYSCAPEEKAPNMKCIKVKASAYNSVPYQTRPGSSGDITAWGDTLVDSIPSIAISRDLLDSGLVHGTMVKIHGYTEKFVVNDKMNRRYTKRIDIHFGKDIRAARKFGVRKLKICWEMPDSAAVLTPEN